MSISQGKTSAFPLLLNFSLFFNSANISAGEARLRCNIGILREGLTMQDGIFACRGGN